MNYQTSLYIFRRDLRITDNTALIEALKQSREVIPIFIFDKKQITHNDYKSQNAIQFMIESLEDLQEQLKKQQGKLFLFYGDSQEIIQQLLESIPIQALFVNEDYTPFARKRDEKIRKLCDQHDCVFESFEDYMLSPIKQITKGDGGRYTVFTPFYNTAKTIPVSKPQNCAQTNFYTKDIEFSENFDIYKKILPEFNKNIAVHGGREKARKILTQIQTISDYKTQRDFPAIKGTSLLSAHHKFGTISIRETFHQTRQIQGLETSYTRELYWRDFYTYIAYHFPKVFGKEFQEKYSNIRWSYDTELFQKWRDGKTGFPIVDAGMRQLNTTGYMHNRVRMIVASFLIKDLLIDWRLGEKYFAQKLVDYDPCVNNGSWQWAASTGCDAQPYFRIFNPWLQQKRFDGECTYIKKWVPELREFTPKQIHDLETQLPIQNIDYPKQIINHFAQKQKALALFKKT